MILHQFPELQWLKKQAEEGFVGRRAWDGRILPQQGWPTVILNTETSNTYRDNIPGPLSIFANLAGTSTVDLQKKRISIKEDFFVVSNHGQRYTLEIDNPSPTQTFNIHFGEYFADQLLDSLKTPSALLDNDFQKPDQRIEFYNHLQRHDQHTKRLILQIKHQGENNPLYLEEKLYELLTLIITRENHVRKMISQLPALRHSTRMEIFQRLLTATDYIYSFYDRPLSLDELASASCLSKFHFLRLFKIAFKKTPHQFITEVRITKAKELLRHTKLEINEISCNVGFDNASAFSRMFFNVTGSYPTQFRM